MKQVQVFFLMALFPAYYDATTVSTPSTVAIKERLLDVQGSGESHDVKEQDPVGKDGIKSASEQRKGHKVYVADTKFPRPSDGRKLVVAKCSPQLYRVSLRNGNCSKAVLTKMCYGQCKSYSFPRRSTFIVGGGDSRRRVDTSCNCCSAVQISTRRHNVACSIGTKARTRTKVFYLPFVKSCTCRPCRVH